MKKMININNDLIKELRKRTNISIMKCKQALIHTHGDIELAIDYMRKFGLEIAERKSSRITPSGLVITKISSNKHRGVILEINCETDFVARDNIFQEFVKIVAFTALNENINNIDLLKSKFEAQRISLIAKIGENINIRRFMVLTGNFLSCYTHFSKIGVIISTRNCVTAELIKCIAMHIAAKNPKYIHINEVPEDVIIREKRIQIDIAIRFGKSQKILEKIVEGKMNKFFDEIVLTRQSLIMDTNKTIKELLDENHIQIHNFVRFEMGNDI